MRTTVYIPDELYVRAATELERAYGVKVLPSTVVQVGLELELMLRPRTLVRAFRRLRREYPRTRDVITVPEAQRARLRQVDGGATYFYDGSVPDAS